tara:strand:+ start:2206 stop:3099 length:894 start_codon:yes stop_codon:yes gene_type:complete
MKTPLRYPGGKSRAVKYILPLIPEDCGELCSPFLGGGSVELAVAERGTKVYGYDIFAPLVWFWEALLEDPERLSSISDSYRVEKEYDHKGKIERKKGLPLESFRQFRDEIKEELSKKDPQFSFDLAAKVYAINRSSFSGATLSGGFSKRASYARFTDSSIDRIRNFKEPNLLVQRMDFKQSIARHPNAFLYLDPPYMLNKEWVPEHIDERSGKIIEGYWMDRDRLYGKDGNLHHSFDHRALYNILTKRKNWVLSYNDSPEIRDLYRDYEILKADWAYGMKNVTTKKMGSSSELLIIG